jgi:uncharacterized protein
MGKIVFWIIVVFLVLFVLRLWNAGKARARAKRQPSAETMVRCIHCGVFLPRPEAVQSGKGYRCRAPTCAGER